MEQVQIQLLIEAGSAPKTLGEVKQSIKDINLALKDVPFGSKAFRDLDAVLKNNRETVRNLKKEYDTMQNVSIFAKNVSSAFLIATSAVGLFGKESKQVEQTLQKVMSAFALVQSIQQFTEGLKLASSANKALNASLLVNPYVIIAASIIAVAGALYLMANNADDAKAKIDKINSSIAETNRLFEAQKNAISRKANEDISATQNAVKQAQIRQQSIKDEIALQKKEIIDLQNLSDNIDESAENGAESLAAAQEKVIAAKEHLKDLNSQLIISTNSLKKTENDAALTAKKNATDTEKQKEADAQKEKDRQLEDYIAFVLFGNQIAADEEKTAQERIASLDKVADENSRLEKNFILETKSGIEQRLALYDLEAETRIDDLRKSGLSELEIQKIISDGRTKIIEEEAKKNADAVTAINKKQLTDIKTGISEWGSLANQTGALITKAAQEEADKRVLIYAKERDAKIQIESQRVQAGLETQEEFEWKKHKIENEFNQRRRREQIKAFKASKAASIIQATIATALAVVNALDAPPPASYIMAAVSGALGAAQIGLIAAQPVPQYAKGGVFAGGGMVSGAGTGTSDSINARLSNGESILNARSTAAFAPILSAINQFGGGVNFTGQPKLITNPSGVESNNVKTQESEQSNIRVFVTEEDISRTQNKIKTLRARTTL